MSQELMIVAFSALGPVVGSGIGVWKKPSVAYITNMLYFAAGIMLAISFFDLIPESRRLGSVFTCGMGVGLGAIIIWSLDKLLPNVHHCMSCGGDECKIGHTANFLILALFLHNFPEGMAIGIGAQSGLGESLVIAAAIALHNIPEGICTSAPHYYAYGNRLKSFAMSSLSALPIIAGYFVAKYVFSDISSEVMSVLIGATAGVMIFIAVHELIPAAKNGKSNYTIGYLVLGVVGVILLAQLV